MLKSLGRVPESEASAAFIDQKQCQVCGNGGRNVFSNLKTADMFLQLPNQNRKVENVVGKPHLFSQSR